MTIREEIQKKVKRIKLIGLFCWLVFGASLFWPGNFGLSPITFLAFAGFMGVTIFSLFALKCPRCDANIGQVAMTGKMKFCPNCGVDVEERNEI